MRGLFRRHFHDSQCYFSNSARTVSITCNSDQAHGTLHGTLQAGAKIPQRLEVCAIVTPGAPASCRSLAFGVVGDKYAQAEALLSELVPIDQPTTEWTILDALLKRYYGSSDCSTFQHVDGSVSVTCKNAGGYGRLSGAGPWSKPVARSLSACVTMASTGGNQEAYTCKSVSFQAGAVDQNVVAASKLLDEMNRP